MRAVTVYRLDDGGNFSFRTRHPIGSVMELRTQDRVNNSKDLLRMARRLFAVDTTDTVRIVIDVGQGRQATPQERTRDGLAG